MSELIYAVGDIHGRLDLLQQLLQLIRLDAAGKPYKLVFLGDYVDRGPDSKGVINELMGLDNTICLMGNHEKMMLDADGPFYVETMWHWCTNGGHDTLESYGAPKYDTAYPPSTRDLMDAYNKYVDPVHLAWMDELPLFYETDTHFFVHAGVWPGDPLDRQKEQNMLWIRNAFLYQEHDYGKHIVHGHTPRRIADLHSWRTGLDTGAYYYGVLTAGRFDQPGGPSAIIQTTLPADKQREWD
jgi:serine/threonine protein phosphatase 1